jgi:DNA-3-methyladenine glycosylase I
MKEPKRCPWPGTDPIYVSYHDKEWGRPVLDSRDLFAKLILDGAQAGLSWITILKRRQGYYDAFAGLDPRTMARFDERKIEDLLQDPGIIRNRLKVNAAITNARAFLQFEKEEGSFSDFLWSFTENKMQVNRMRDKRDYRATSPESDAMSKALKKRGFKFVGSTICYAFMQAVGMVNDHLDDCHCKEPCIREAKKLKLL